MRRPRWVAPLLATLGALVVAEIGFRLASFEFNPYAHYEKEHWGNFVEGRNRTDYLADPEVFWRLLPARTIDSSFAEGAHVNSHGFRGPEIAVERAPGRLRIATLGDSGTFGWKVSDAECYPRQLEATLNTLRPQSPVEVLNAGVPGYTSLQGMRQLESQVRRFKPDLVIVAFGGNDPDKLDKADKDRELGAARLALQNFLLGSRLYQFLYKTIAVRRLDVRSLESRPGVERVSLEDFASNLDRIAEIDSEFGAHTIFLARPGAREKEYMGAVRAVADHCGAPFVAEGIVGHPPGAEYGAVARRVARVILEWELLPKGR